MVHRCSRTIEIACYLPAELEAAFEEGLHFDGSAIDGFSRVQESDVLAIPDANSFELLPWVDPSEPTGRIFCDIHNLDGTPFAGDPRHVLRRNLQQAKEKGSHSLLPQRLNTSTSKTQIILFPLITQAILI
ncbi:MAG: hypothetical protein CM15mP49_36710 [Actinomycetota bacterium]|nr:MAG: hypothetical protein CM15mP49_36710 [Actinomycetota bacterium]